MTYRLMGIPGSPFVRKTRVMLLEKGLPFKDVFTNIFPVPPEFAAINPMKRVPVLAFEHEGETVHLADTTAIAQYLEHAHPAPSLFPANAVGVGRAMMWEEFADTTLAAPIGLGVFRPLVLSRMLGKEPDFDRVRRALEVKLPPLFDVLTTTLSDDAYFFGAFSVVDIAVATHFVNLHHAGQSVDPARWPELAAWVERVHQRDSFAGCIAAERKMIPPPVPLPG